MAVFEVAHKFTAAWEGGISDHPADRGGYTAYGVSTGFMKDLMADSVHRAFLAGLGLAGPVDRKLMARIGKAEAAAIFRHYFWKGQALGDFDQAIATVWYDAAVNHGPGRAARFMQQALNRVRGAMLAVDGIAGPRTRAAAQGAGRVEALMQLEIRSEFFRSIVASRPSQKVFLKGWLNRVNALRQLVPRL